MKSPMNKPKKFTALDCIICPRVCAEIINEMAERIEEDRAFFIKIKDELESIRKRPNVAHRLYRVEPDGKYTLIGERADNETRGRPVDSQ